MNQNKYRLEGLNCANCAAKIEQKINKLEIVQDASINFVTKELKVNAIENVDRSELLKNIVKIIDETEKGVKVNELSSQKDFIYSIDGLDCANCAAKIESQLNDMEGIVEAHINFVAEKLTLKFAVGVNKEIIFKDIQKLIDRIEPGATITEINGHLTDTKSKRITYSGEIIRFIISASIFIIAIIIGDASNLYLPMFIISYALVGFGVVYKAFRNISKGQIFDENFLMTIATFGAFAIKEYPEAVAVMLFYQIGEFFQDIAVNKSRKSIEKLMSIRPDVANVKIGDTVTEMSVDNVKIDDIIVIKPGEKIPLDGIIIDGNSSLDTKVLTGESLPLSVTIGENVMSGCININGLLTVKVTKLASESTVAKILEMVENASSKKAPTENFITKFARVYTPLVTIAAILLATIPPLVIDSAEFQDWLYRSLTFLVISCPCALVVSIPLGFFGGIGNASRNGILVKGGSYLEALNNLEIAVFDKTGTLTEGSFKVACINNTDLVTSDELLEIAAHIESFSNHPIATSILSEYGKDIKQELVSEVEEVAGHGIKAIFRNNNIVIGNSRLMVKENIMFEETNDIGSNLYIGINGTYVGNIVVSDQIRKDSKHTIKLLKNLGIKKTVMLTGDKDNVATSVGKDIGIDEIYSELLPEDKLYHVEELFKHKSKKGKLFVVGDGINDTPVLARADIGIAMGGLGADAAIDVADIIIMSDEPSKIITAVKIAKKTRRIVWQNIIFTMAVKGFFLTLGAFGIATMWEAVIADVGVALVAVLNSMRVLNYNQ